MLGLVPVRLSRDGNRVAVGSLTATGNATDDGKIEVFKYDGNSYIQLGQDILGDKTGDKLSRATALSADGRTVAGGSIDGDNDLGTSTGYVKVFRLENDPDVSLPNIGIVIGKEEMNESNDSIEVTLSLDSNSDSDVSVNFGFQERLALKIIRFLWTWILLSQQE